MVYSPCVRYVGRYNPTLARKEWRRTGWPTLVVDGGIVDPGDPGVDPIVVTLTKSPATVTAGMTVTLTASATGGIAPYTPTWTAPAGVTLSGSATSMVRTFVAPATASNLVFRVSIADSEPTTAVQEASISVAVGESVVGTPLYAGHTPNHVVISLAGPNGVNPTYDQGVQMVKAASTAQLGVAGAGSYARRRFTGTQTDGGDIAELRQMLAEGDADNVVNWVSFKTVGGNWSGIAAGQYPAIPQMFITVANERKAAGKKPFIASLHHEPRGDYAAGQSLSTWASMHIYMSNATKSVNDVMAWSCIGNGFLWNTATGTQVNQTERPQMFPQTLIDTFRINKHIVAVDTYDDHPVYTGQSTLPLSGTPVQKARTSVKLQNWIAWMRARNCGALGIGEWSCTDAVEMPKVAAAFWRNRDILGIANYFNSCQGASTWDWRLVPSDYPVQQASNEADFGGTALTQARLNYFPTIVRDSMLPANNGPL